MTMSQIRTLGLIASRPWFSKEGYVAALRFDRQRIARNVLVDFQFLIVTILLALSIVASIYGSNAYIEIEAARADRATTWSGKNSSKSEYATRQQPKPQTTDDDM